MYRGLIASPAAQRNVVLALLLAAAAACWTWLVNQTGGHMAAMASPTMGLPAAAFVIMWAVMMIAMMFPAAAPMVLTFHRIEAGKQQRGEAFVSTWLFIAGYTIVWAAAGIAAYFGALASERIAAHAEVSAVAGARIGGGLLVVAGLYQATPLKNACLAKCRSPIAFVLTAWRDGPLGAARMGLLHGATCLGCCWLLMTILFPLGLMNLAAMALVMLIVFAEKTLPWRRAAVFGTAVLLILYGTVVIADPRALPTFAAPTAAMQMPAGSRTDMPGMNMPGMHTPAAPSAVPVGK